MRVAELFIQRITRKAIMELMREEHDDVVFPEEYAKVKRTKKTGYKYKGGVEFNGTFYPSKTELWRQHGTTSIHTFRNRLFKGFSLEDALGITGRDMAREAPEEVV